MAKARTWMPLYIGDYLKDTTHLSTVEHGAYLLLLMHYWTRGGPIPDDHAILANVTRLDVRGWSRAVDRLKPFFEIGGGVWRHKRVEKELADGKEIFQRKSDMAKAAADARWNAVRNADRIINNMQTHCAPHTQSPSPPSEEGVKGTPPMGAVPFPPPKTPSPLIAPRPAMTPDEARLRHGQAMAKLDAQRNGGAE